MRVRQKITLYLVMIVLVATISMGSFAYLYTLGIVKANTADYLTEQAKTYAFELDGAITGLETAVAGLEKTTLATLEPDRFEEEGYFVELSETLERYVSQYDSNESNAMSMYIRFDPQMSYGTAGVFHADTDGDGIMERLVPTDLANFGPGDREHVGWFYEPIEARRPIWMKPYYNANIDIDMVSYVRPIIIGDQAIGTVGADINFDQLRQITQRRIKVGGIIIVDQNYNFLVHDSYTMTDSIGSIDDGQLAYIQKIIEKNESGVIEYRLYNEGKILGYSKLKNGWTVAIAMTEQEAFTKLNGTTFVLLTVILAISLFMLVAALFMGRFINKMIFRNSVLQEMVDDRTTELNDTNRYLETSLSEIQNREAELTVLNDELEKTLQKMNEMQDELVRSEKLSALGGVIAGLAHEINTPLGVVITSNSYLRTVVQDQMKMIEEGEGSANKAVDSCEHVLSGIELIESASTKLTGLVKSFKMLSLDPAIQDIRRIQISKLLRDIEFERKEKLEELGHDLIIDCHEDDSIVSHPDTIKYILEQLISNSMIHGFENVEKGIIHIQAEVFKGKVSLKYSDNGVGIEDSVLEKVFEPFYSTKKNKGSIGLGMHLVHNLVTQVLHGSLDLSSSPDGGIQVKILFEAIDMTRMNEG